MDVASEPEASTSPTLHTAGPTASTVQDDARTCSVNLSVPRLLDEYYRIMSSNHGSDGSSSSFMNGLTSHDQHSPQYTSPGVIPPHPTSGAECKGEFDNDTPETDPALCSRLDYLLWPPPCTTPSESEELPKGLAEAVDPIWICHPEAMLWSTQPDPLSVTPPLADHSNDSSPLQLTSDDELMDDEEDVMAVNDILGPYIGGFDDVAMQDDDESIVFIDTSRTRNTNGEYRKYKYDKTRTPLKSALKRPREGFSHSLISSASIKTFKFTTIRTRATTRESRRSGPVPVYDDSDVAGPSEPRKATGKRVIWDLDSESEIEDEEAPSPKRIRLITEAHSEDEELDEEDEDLGDIIMNYTSSPSGSDPDSLSPEPQDSDDAEETGKSRRPTPGRNRLRVTNP